MVTLSRFQLWHGRNAPPVERRELHAGRLTALLEEGDLRYIRVDGVEVVRRIYVAVRDEVWNTIPATYSDFAYDIAPDHFTIRLRASHRYQPINVDWQGTITGLADGTIRYAMDAVANNAFRYCKIGFNVHHPPQEAGCAYRARGPEGTSSGVLPVLIEPQRNEAGRLTALFPPYDALEIDQEDGLTVRFRFEGDLFEMQDHRNWTDGNYKSYGTPLSIPWPMDATSGERFHQVVSVSVAGTPARPRADAREARLDLGRSANQSLPRIGLGMASHGGSLSAREADRLQKLRLEHLRVDLYLGESWQKELGRGIDAARALAAQLELALFLTDEAEAQLAALARELAATKPPVVRVLAFYGGKAFTTGLGATCVSPASGSRLRSARPRSLAGPTSSSPNSIEIAPRWRRWMGWCIRSILRFTPATMNRWSRIWTPRPPRSPPHGRSAAISPSRSAPLRWLPGPDRTRPVHPSPEGSRPRWTCARRRYSARAGRRSASSIWRRAG